MTRSDKYEKNENDIIEPFCGACLAIPLAFAGTGASAGAKVYGSKGNYKKQQKIKLIAIIINIVLLIISLILWWYFYIYKKCTSCR